MEITLAIIVGLGIVGSGIFIIIGCKTTYHKVVSCIKNYYKEMKENSEV